MKIITLIILSLAFVVEVFSEEPTWPPIGRLGVQLGTVVEIKGKIIDGNSLNYKDSQNNYFIEIHEINNSTTTNNLLMKFRTMFPDYPSDYFSLYKIKTGREPTLGISWEVGKMGTPIEKTSREPTITELQVGYVGRPIHFLAWEIGKFDGIPKNLPEGTPLWADANFGFRTSLVLLDDLTKTNSNQALQPIVKTPVESGKQQGTAAEL